MIPDDSTPRIVCTAASAISAAGIGCEPLIDSIDRRRRHLTLRDGHPIAEITDFDAKQFVRPRKALKVMCREIQTAFAASVIAGQSAGLLDADGQLCGGVDPDRLATVFGGEMLYHPADLAEAMRVAIQSAQQSRLSDPADPVAFGRDGIKHVTPLWLLKHLPNMAACHVGISLGALGPNNTLVTGDGSGIDALAESISCMRRGIADVAVVAAAGTRINETRFTYRCDTPPPRLDRPLDEVAVPGDPASTGVFLGEGAAALIVETGSSARHRRAEVVAEIAAVAQCFVPSAALSMPHRSASLVTDRPRSSRCAISRSIRRVLADAGDPDIDLIVGHQSGDPVSDAEETAAVSSVDALSRIDIVRPMHSIGHCGAASGLLSVAVAVSLLRRDNLRHVLAICHTPEGGATAVVIAAPSAQATHDRSVSLNSPN